MGADFFDSLGEALTKTAREIGERAEQIYEVQKLRNRISGEERMVDKILIDVGNLIYKRYESGEEMEPEITVLCEEVRQHIRKIREYKRQAAGIKGRKVCQSCGKAIDKEVSYCPYCGTACTFEEAESETEECADDAIERTGKTIFPGKNFGRTLIAGVSVRTSRKNPMRKNAKTAKAGGWKKNRWNDREWK